MNLSQKIDVNGDKRVILALMAMISLGLALRLYYAQTLSLWHDEAVHAYSALSLLENGVPDFPSGEVDWRAIAYTGLSAVSAKLFGSSDISLRAPSIIFGALSIPLTYIAGKEWFDKDTGLIAAALIAFSAWHIAISTQVRMYMMLQFVYLTALILIYRLGKRFEIKNLLFLAAVLMTGLFTHRTAYILPVVALIYIIYSWRESLDRKKLGAMALLSLTLFFIGEIFFYSYFGIVENLMENTVFNRYVFQWYTEELFFTAPFVISTGLLGSLIAYRENRKVLGLMAISILPTIYIYTFHYIGMAQRYFFHALPFLCICSGVLIKNISAVIEERFETGAQKYLSILFIISAILMSTGLTYNFESGQYRPYYENKDVYDYIESKSSGDEVLMVDWDAAALYYYRAPDYALLGDHDPDDFDHNGVSEYAGAEFITERHKLEKVISDNNDGWIVLRKENYERKPENMKEVLSRLENTSNFKGLYVWRWNES